MNDDFLDKWRWTHIIEGGRFAEIIYEENIFQQRFEPLISIPNSDIGVGGVVQVENLRFNSYHNDNFSLSFYIKFKLGG